MNTKKPIVFVIGVEGQIYLSEALRREFKRPVIAIASSQRVMEMLTPERRAIFEKIYSLPDFYLEQIGDIRKLSREELDLEQRALEKELGVFYGALFSFYDRNLRSLNDYKKLRYWELCNLRFAKKIMGEVDPAFVMDGVVIYLQHVLRSACRKRNVPYIIRMPDRTRREGMALFDEVGQQIGMSEIFEELEAGKTNSLTAADMMEADKQFDVFVRSPARPGYAVRNSILRFNFRRLYAKAKWALRPRHMFPSEKVRLVDRAINIENSSLTIAMNAVIHKYRRTSQEIMNVFDKTPDMEAPFIYLPLHYSPEISDQYFGAEYDHHEGFVTQVAKFVPSHMQLYVKEHTSMLGRRPTSFYRSLKKLPNVRLIHPQVGTFELISRCKAVLTVTGTAGWEAFLLGKPVIVLGNVFYNFLPGVLHHPVNMDLLPRIEEYLETFKSPESVRRNAYRACYASSFAAVSVDIGHTTTHGRAAEDARVFARLMREALEKFSRHIRGIFPDDFLNNSDSLGSDDTPVSERQIFGR